MPATSVNRSRPDLCPGALRPWPADDGALVRLRPPGGLVPAASLRALVSVATTYGDDAVHLTGRANLQLRALPATDGVLEPEVLAAIEATGLLPSRTHELVRNLMASPLTGLVGGRADLRPVVAELDRLLCADPALAGLPGRFLFVLDDGRGDLVTRTSDLGLVALDRSTAQLRVGAGWGPVVPLADAPAALVGLAALFQERRGDGPTAAWHIDELAEPLVQARPADPRALVAGEPTAYGRHGGVEHVEVPDGVLVPELALALAARGPELVVTPWRGLVVAALDGGAR
ncbi:nitrite reductase [Nocardioides lijunqiniae]|uniref:nitrite reductase n=1 Tax=Nocardioides lijunqiniae TaxID=2760832 RepID=UPI001877608E